ncbi:MAG: carboxypeptidase regulatory-like domain-containing protein [Planctomycetes bacterium]|nr:carboxypeptidase regulatory-like domain-containing protein [Planctomycetota bacterium]
MRARLAGLAVALALDAGVVWWRASARACVPPAAATSNAPEPSAGEASRLCAPAAEDLARAREQVSAVLAAPTTLRGRVVAAEGGAGVEGCTVDLEFVQRTLARTHTDEAGRFAFDEALPEGAELHFEMPSGFELDSSVHELDGVPREELVFVAHALPTDVVRGEVVDELTGERVPYLRFSLGDEKLESDAHGAFVTRARYSRGVLRVSVMNWPFEMSWDPQRAAQVLVPARVGPAFFLHLDRPCAGLAWRQMEDGSESRAALPLEPFGSSLVQCGPPDLVRFQSEHQGRASEGELLLLDPQGFSCAFAQLAPGRGAEAEWLSFTFQPCGYLALEVNADRDLRHDEAGDVIWTLSPRASDGHGWKAV